MNRETIRRLLVASGLAMLFLFLAIGTALPLHAAPPPHTSTLRITQSPAPAPSPTFASSPWGSPLPSPTQLPRATPTPAEPLTSTPAPTQAPTNTPMPTATFTTVPMPTAIPALSPFDKAITLVTQNPFWMAGICLIPLLILGLLLILATLWRARPRPTPSSPPPPPVPTGPYLESTATPGSQGRLHLKPDGVTIGQTSENDLVITQDLPGWETVSRRHARIYAQSGRWIVEDLGSMNGIYVNGRRTGRNLLRDGWRLGVGGVEFVFHASTGEE
jgi:hypothetical protein